MPTSISGTSGVDKVKDRNAVPFLPFTQEFVSAEQTILQATALTLPHGLGVVPRMFRASVICKTAEHGYSVGDVLEVQCTGDVSDSAGAFRGMSLVADATNINIRFVANTTVFQIVHKSTGIPAALTSANWRLIVRAWA